MNTVRVAFEGCCHGELDKIYAELARKQDDTGKPLDLLIICGDFQAIRNQGDLSCLACPPKYRHMGDFHAYYRGEKKAPVLTIFIGGNHEASNHLWELYYGGWIAPNIYYLGHSGVINFRGLRIGGVSGIWSQWDHSKPYYERIPYSGGMIKSAYHTRDYEIQKLSLLGLYKEASCEARNLDIFVSHDWPQNISKYGNLDRLLRIKPYFKNDINTGKLGSPALMPLLQALQPSLWAAAHLHVKFVAVVNHEKQASSFDSLSSTERAFEAPVAKVSRRNDETIFLSLDKCLPRRSYLQIVEFDGPELTASEIDPNRLYYDREWLRILKIYNRFFPIEGNADAYKGGSEFDVGMLFEDNVDLPLSTAGYLIPLNFVELPSDFCQFTESKGQKSGGSRYFEQDSNLKPWNNPQTSDFCKMFSLENFPWALQAQSNKPFVTSLNIET